jgi:hypothetical protein
VSQQEQVLDLPIGRSLAEGVDPKLLPMGAAAKLENFEVLRGGGITKRKGWGLRLRLEDSTDITPRYKVEGDGTTLRAVCPSPASGIPHLYTYSEGLDLWSDQDDVSPCSVERRGLVATTDVLAFTDVVPFGSGAFLLVVYGALSSDTFYKIVDARTGATIQQATSLTSGFYSRTACVQINNDVWVLYNHRTNGFSARKISGTDLSETIVVLSATAAAHFDANLYSLAEVVFAYSTAASSTLRFGRIANATATVSVTGNYAAGGTVENIGVCGNATVGVQAIYHEGAAHDVRVIRMLANLSGTSGGPYTLEATPAFWSPGVAIAMNGTTTCCAYEVAATAQDRGRVQYKEVDSGGSVVNPRNAHRCCLASGLHLIQGRIYGLVVAWQDCLAQVNNAESGLVSGLTSVEYTAGTGITDSTTGSGPVSHVALVCFNDPDSSILTFAAKAGTINATKTFGQYVPKMWPILSDELRWVAPLITYDPGRPLRLEQLTLDWSPRQGPNLHSALPRPLYVLGGGLVSSGDGTSNAEFSFLQGPTWGEPSFTFGGDLASSPTGVTYLYRARYEWYDDAGLLHVSPWSPDLAITLIDAASGGWDIGLVFTCTQISRRGRLRFGLGRQPKIAIYRSAGNSITLSGDVVYYRLREWDALPTNNTSLFSTTFTDDSDDADLLARGFGQEVAPRGLLAPICPPASIHLCLHRGRLWLASAETGRDLWASRQLTRGEQPVFPPELQVTLADSPDRLTALASLDDKLVCFTTGRIYYLVGEGPADNGTGEFWPAPWLVTAQHGCLDSRSLVTTPEGVFFQTSAGIALLTRNLTVSLVGEAIRDLTDERPTCLGAVHDPKRSRVVWLFANADGETVGAVYDYLHQTWSRQDTAMASELFGIALWQDLLVVTADELLRAEGEPGNPDDRGQDVAGDPSWVTGVYETPWICPQGPGAYQRHRRLVLLGEKLSGCSLRVDIYLDFDAATVKQTHTLDLQAASTITGLPLVRYEVPLTIQASQAIKVRLTDLPPDASEPPAGVEPRVGVSLQRMALEFVPERGTPRLPALNRGGGG